MLPSNSWCRVMVKTVLLFIEAKRIPAIPRHGSRRNAELMLFDTGASTTLQDLPMNAVVRGIQILADSYPTYLPLCAAWPKISRK